MIVYLLMLLVIIFLPWKYLWITTVIFYLSAALFSNGKNSKITEDLAVGGTVILILQIIEWAGGFNI